MGITLPEIFSPTPTLKPKEISKPICHLPQHFISPLKSCSNVKQFLPIHAQLITTNLIHDPLIANHILQFFISIQNIDYGRRILSQISIPETIIWNTLLGNQLREQEWSPKEVFLTYYQMVTHGVLLDITTLHFLLHACSKGLAVQQGSEIHGRILKSGFGWSSSLRNNLMGMYAKAGSLEEVIQLFEENPCRDVVSWNTIISCHVHMGSWREALDLFGKMGFEGIRPDEITMVSLISACAKLRNLETGEKLHLYIDENDLEISGSLLNCLVDMYIKCGKIKEAYKLLGRSNTGTTDVVLWTTLITGFVKIGDLTAARNLFDKMTQKNLIAWTTMISGYVQGEMYNESLELFVQMRLENVRPDEVALVTALSACAHTENSILGRSIHSMMVKQKSSVDGFMGNCLINLYAKCSKIDEAFAIFESLPSKNVVSWNAMLDGYCRSGDTGKARSFFDKIPEKDIVSWNTMINCYAKFHLFEQVFELFYEMQKSSTEPNNLTLISVLSACASVGALNHGIWVHVYIKRNQIEVDSMLATALIDMYGKCGSIEKAIELFSKVTHRNVVVWTAMIAAHAMEGQPQQAIDLFLEMEVAKIKPDHITFIALLSACSHAGLVDEGYYYFNKMRGFYNIDPNIQHYGCMVDLLGRVGCLEEALKIINTMPIEADISIWSSLLRACATQHNVQLAEYAFEQLVKMDPKNDSAYVLLSNIYAKTGRLDDVSRVRTKLKETGIEKQPGCSLIEQNGVVYRFTCEDFSHPMSAQIYQMLDEIKERLPDLQDASSFHHGEKLAVAYGLITSGARTPIRVANKLRTCSDCHLAMRLISEVYEREIVIRDNYRFHRFRNGTCSCKDQW